MSHSLSIVCVHRRWVGSYARLARYGATKVRHELAKQGVPLNRKTVARIMRESSLRSKVVKKFKVRTTDSNHAYAAAKNVLNREFTADTLDQSGCAILHTSRRVMGSCISRG